MTQTKGYFVRLTVTLLVISAVVAGLLGLTNHVTADKIAVLNQEKTAASMEQVLPADSYTPLDYSGSQTEVAAVYQAGPPPMTIISYICSISASLQRRTFREKAGAAASLQLMLSLYRTPPALSSRRLPDGATAAV